MRRSDSKESVASTSSCVSGVGEWSIGDRVRLGEKVGTLAFVGHTKFAPGEWIGLILDEPEGKNNGSVQGVAYFSCPPNHGIFCKSSKLERIGTAASPRASHSPAPQKTHNEYAETFGFDVGDRVIVSGGKIGTLRYLGMTEFAAGVWCGVELESAVGKNDGSVQDHRYFTCRPLHGIFAPAVKTEKAPNVNTPCKIRVHHNKTSMLRQRTGSHESLNSIGASSVASRMTAGNVAGVRRGSSKSGGGISHDAMVRALQETILEKDTHIEQLLQERELERNDMAELVNAKDSLQEELQLLTAGTEKNALALSRLEKLESERKTMKLNIIEKDKLIDDLQFRLEEESIVSQSREANVKSLTEEVQLLKGAEVAARLDKTVQEEDLLSKMEQDSEQKVNVMKKALDEALHRVKELETQMEGEKAKGDERLEEHASEAEQKRREEEKKRAEERAEIEKKHEEEMRTKEEERLKIVESHRSVLTEMEKKMSHSEATLRLLQAESVQLKEKLHGEEKEKESLIQQLAALENEGVQHKQQTLQQKEIEAGEKKDATETIQKLKGMLEEKEKELLGREAELKNLQVLKSNEEAALLAEKNKNTQLEDGRRESEETIHTLRNELTEKEKKWEGEREKLQNVMKQKEEDVTREKKELAEEWGKERDALHSQLLALSTAQEELKTKVAEADAENARIKKDHKEEEEKRMKENEQVALAHKEAVQGEETKVKEAKELLDRERKEKEEMRKELAQKDSQLSLAQQQVEALQKTMESSRLSEDEKTREAREAHEEKGRLRARILQLEEEGERTKELIHSAQQRHEEEQQSHALSEQQSAVQLEEEKARREELKGKWNEEKEKLLQCINEERKRREEVEGEKEQKMVQEKKNAEDVTTKEKELEELKGRMKETEETFLLRDTEWKEKELHYLHMIAEKEKEVEETTKTATLSEEKVRKEAEEKRIEAETLHEQLNKMRSEMEQLRAKEQELETSRLAEADDSHSKEVQLNALLAEKKREAENLCAGLEGEKREREEAVKMLRTTEEKLRLAEEQAQQLMQELRDFNVNKGLLEAEKVAVAEELKAKVAETKRLEDAMKAGEERERRAREEGEQKCSLLSQELTLNVHSLQSKGEEALKYIHLLNELQKKTDEMESQLKEEKEKNEKFVETRAQEMNAGGKEVQELHTVNEQLREKMEQMRREADAERDERKAHIQLFDELEKEWRKKEEKLAARIDQLSGELEASFKRSANEEVHSLKQQVEFLNQIIVDKQQKEEQLKKQLESLSRPQEHTTRSNKHKVDTPRVFCDICEVFDAHDTEDCPTQSQQDEQVRSPQKKVKPPPREYCDDCEEFGHSTECCPKSHATALPPHSQPKVHKKDYTF